MIDYLIQNQKNPKLLYAGAKVMKFKEQKFNISLVFIPMPLSKLPKTFALQERTEKGHYPHWFNTMANFNYVGPIPDEKDFGYDRMSIEKRTEFLQWYTQHEMSGARYGNHLELEKYCVNDTLILALALGCMSYVHLLLLLEKGVSTPLAVVRHRLAYVWLSYA